MAAANPGRPTLGHSVAHACPGVGAASRTPAGAVVSVIANEG